MNANGTVKGLQAPCGRIVDGETYEDHDDEVVVTRETFYSCGCQSIQHEYHDGSVSRDRPARRRVLIDETCSPRNSAGEAHVTPSHDVVLVGGGGAGLRAAIAIAETNPTPQHRRRVQGVPDAEPHRLRRGWRGGRRSRPDDSLDEHAYDTISGGDWLCDQDAVEAFVKEAPRGAPPPRALGLSRGAGRPTAGLPFARSAA